MLFNKSWLTSWLNPWRLDYNTSSRGLLLDTMATPAVAFSTRKLRTAYSGQCLRVRRSSDNAEQDIGFVAGKLDTASLLSFVGAGDGFVTTWYDQSGNARNATQATALKQLYVVQAGATIAFGVQGDVALLNPAENRFLDYTIPASGIVPWSSLSAQQRVTTAGAVQWNLGGPYYASTGIFDLGGDPVATANTVARVFVSDFASGAKRLRHSGGTTVGVGALGYGAPTTGLIGTHSDGYGSPMNATHHTCIIWHTAVADIDTPYATAAGWL